MRGTVRRAGISTAALLLAAALDASSAGAAAGTTATPELAAALHRLSDEVGAGLSASGAPALGEPELRRRLARAQRELVVAGGSDRWLDPFFERQKDAKDDAARADLARDAAISLDVVASHVDRALAARADRTVRRERDAAASARITAILNEAEFRKFPRETGAPTWWNRLVARVLRWWHTLRMPALPSSVTGVGSWVVTLVVCVLGMWVIGRGLRNVLRASPRRAGRRAASSAGRHAASRTVDDLDRLLRDSLASGAFREALRAVHLAALGRLGSVLDAPPPPGETHWDLARRLASRHVVSDALDRFATLNREFDDAWYGRTPVDAARFERFREQSALFVGEIRSTRTDAPAPASRS